VPIIYTIKTIEQAEKALLPFVPLVAQLTGKDTTLQRIRPLMTLLGNPQEQLRVIHIAGTSGKTSTAYFIAALLHASGKRVGLTVSPHVDSVTERVQINGKPFTDDIFCQQLSEFLEKIKNIEVAPSYFELLYAFAIWEFAQAEVDYAVIETGLGGLYDATNITERPDKVCVITDIGYDHMHILGNTLPEIAAQKIGIVHDHNPVIMYEQAEDIMTVINTWTRKHHALLQLTTETQERSSCSIDVGGMPAYQQRNWLLAHCVYEFVSERDNLPVLLPTQLEATQALQVPGRMDYRAIDGKILIMDGAHNTQKMAAFVTSFKQRHPNTKPAMLVAFKTGKEYVELAPLLASFASSIIVTTFTTSQDLPATAIDPHKVAAAFIAAGNSNVFVIQDKLKAYKALRDKPSSILVITGSFYLLSQLRREAGLP
jgi:dihydrofolate synthase/folylpolyglutamate synthase